MVRTRKSTRSRGKKKSTSQTSSSAPSKKTGKSKQKTPKTKSTVAKALPKSPSFTSSTSDTSPFKGYEHVPEEVKEPQLFESLLGDDEIVPSEARDDLFDRLIQEDLPNNLHRNIRTYSNKKKDKLYTEHSVLEFQDCKNRNEIQQWLNDNRNLFDRITQTQTESTVVNTDTQMTLDLPSVSQQNTPKTNRSRKESKRVHRSPYKLRARSLDIKVKKNLLKGRNRSYSLAGSTPALENYHIEEVVTDEDVPVPAEKDMIFIDLMEDEYLNNIEREIMQSEDKKNLSSSTGWDRIKDINKTIRKTKKQPKQLKIVLQSSDNKKGANVTENNVPSYDYQVLENYFIENMDKLLKDEKDESDTSKTSNNGRFSIKNAIQVGKNFLTCVKKVVENEGKQCLSEFRSVISEINKLFDDISVKESATQTYHVQNLDKSVQTERNVINMMTQTARIMIHASVQTLNNENIPLDAKENLSVSKVNTAVQTEDKEQVKKKFCKEPTSATSATPDIFEDDKDKQEILEAFNVDIQNENDVQDDDSVSEVFKDDLNFDFNTEDLLKNLPKPNKIIEEPIEKPKTRESVLIISTESKSENKGVKRQSESPVDSEEFPKRRPCARFIMEDVSVAFSLCTDENEGREVQFSEGSDDINYDEQITNILKKYESTTDNCVKDNSPPKAKVQNQINELENMISNSTRPSMDIHKEIQSHGTSHKLEDDLDYFNLASDVSEAEETPKSSRRCLFDSKNAKDKTSNVFSESLFGTDRNDTVVADKTITPHNVDRSIDEGRETRDVCDSHKDKNMKIHILEDVVIKGNDNCRKSDASENSDDCSDVDFVESTPQKSRFSSFTQQRDESALDVTLPPPVEFQDSKKSHLDHNTSKVFDRSPSRRPLAAINKITSTPMTQKIESQYFPELSPISAHGRIPKSSPTHSKSRSELSFRKPVSNRENRRGLGPFEYVQQQLSKFSPLTIVKRAQSQDSFRLTPSPKQKSILNYVRPSQEHQETLKSQKVESTPPSGKSKPCIACSRISRDQVIAISTLTNRKLATYSTSFSQKVTHLIVSTNERNCLKDHTIKFVSAVAAGIWVLNFGWVEQCLQNNMLVPEEPFEVLDVSGVSGPRQARLTRNTNPLFKGYKIHAAVPFASTTQQEVENVVKMLGGIVVPSPNHLLDKNGYVCVIVTEARATQDFELYETWLETLKTVTVDIEWLSRSVGQYRLLSLRPFTLCSDDGIENLGYPPELTVNMTYSFSQQTFSSVPSST